MNLLKMWLLLLFLLLAACGENSDTTGIRRMGGSIQGNQLSLSKEVSTFAGTITAGSTDGTNTRAAFFRPLCVTTDGTNLFVTDNFNHTIRKIVLATGEVTTIAGRAGIAGSADGIGTDARFTLPYGITTDGTNLYVADSNNNTIRRVVISTGEVTTIAGVAGAAGYVDAIGTAARFDGPSGITTDGVKLYVSDSNNNVIREINAATGEVRTIAGTSGTWGSTDGIGLAAKFNLPREITTDGTSLYVADMNNHTIRKILISTGAVTTIAGFAESAGSIDGTGSTARFSNPSGITTDGINLYVGDYGNKTIRRISIETGAVTTIAGTAGSSGTTDGTGATAMFGGPSGITTDGNSVFVADVDNNVIRKIR